MRAHSARVPSRSQPWVVSEGRTGRRHLDDDGAPDRPHGTYDATPTEPKVEPASRVLNCDRRIAVFGNVINALHPPRFQHTRPFPSRFSSYAVSTCTRAVSVRDAVILADPRRANAQPGTRAASARFPYEQDLMNVALLSFASVSLRYIHSLVCASPCCAEQIQDARSAGVERRIPDTLPTMILTAGPASVADLHTPAAPATQPVSVVAGPAPAAQAA